MRPQPLLSVTDVPAASRWYQDVLGLVSIHGGEEYDQLACPAADDGSFVLQLHRWDVEDHHGHIGDPALPNGNGVLVWFEVDDLDAVVDRAKARGAEVVIDLQVNPNAAHREIWLRDLDGYVVVAADAVGSV
jgi:catechol 2,3-dioxygenase-like lactoylglutathione lyase family enzyme